MEWHSGFRGPCQGKPAGMASSRLLIHAVVRWDGGVWREDRSVCSWGGGDNSEQTKVV